MLERTTQMLVIAFPAAILFLCISYLAPALMKTLFITAGLFVAVLLAANGLHSIGVIG
jgi:hypothetical protein